MPEVDPKMQHAGLTNTMSRRDLLAAGAAAASLAGLPSQAMAETESPRGKADHCIFIWLGGGQAQIDTWDPKNLGDPKAKTPGSYYESIPSAIPRRPALQTTFAMCRHPRSICASAIGSSRHSR